MLNPEIHAELVAEFTNQVTSSIRYQFQNLTTRFGPAMHGVTNSTAYRVWAETVRPCVDAHAADPFALRCGKVDSYTLNDDKVARMAARIAVDFADAVIAKVNAKVGELENGVAAHVGGARFTIHGTKNGRTVTIEQDQIINVSVKGKLFNQYPARIYVDRKFTSAAAFAKL